MVLACHDTKESAIDQAIAVSLAEDTEYLGEREQRAPVPGKDKYTTKEEALARAKAIGCEGTHSMDENGQTIFMPCSTHAAYDKLTSATPTATGTGYRNEPAPKEDQIEGSDVNKPGSAAGAGGDVELSERTETALRNKVKEHNDAMEADGKPRHTRTTYGQLAAVYRRGSGAFSTSHRPGISRAAWSMARVNAFLYLLRNGKPENAAYVTDNDLLPEGHPKSSRSSEDYELRQVDGQPAIILDVDNTLIRNGEMNQPLIAWLNTFRDTKRFIITARPESEREQTKADLMTFSHDALIMKADDTPTVDYKLREAGRLLQNHNVMIAVDDSNPVLLAYRSIGITAIHPNEVPTVRSEVRNTHLTPPAYFRASARRGLEWVSQGHAGDGLLDRTKREAAAMAEGNMTADKWVRTRAFLARHLVDLDAPAANPESDDYPSPGVVAIALWGGGGTKRSAMRALDYATGVVDRLNAENEGRTKGDSLTKLETRIFDFDLELREEGDEMSLTGYAALFNSRSENLGGFTEIIAPGAFGRSLKSRNDVKLLWNHDTSAVMGSTRAGTLELMEDERGLRVKAKLPNTTYGRDAKELIKRGDVTGFSFGFSMPGKGGDDWNSEGTERTLKSVRLHEISLTAFPAYTETNGTAQVRGLDKIAQRADVDADLLADALLKVEQGEEITADDRNLLSKVIDTLSPVTEPDTAPLDDGLLNLKKLKAKILMKGI